MAPPPCLERPIHPNCCPLRATHCYSSSRFGVALRWVVGGKAELLTRLPLPQWASLSPWATWGHLEGTDPVRGKGMERENSTGQAMQGGEG